MAATATVIEGIVNFSNVTQHDVFNGQSTGAYSMTITIDEEDAAFLASQGVKIKDYQGNKQRKFKSKYEVKRFTADGNRLQVRSLITLRSASSSRWVNLILYTAWLLTLRP